jgi:hypothetical protein
MKRLASLSFLTEAQNRDLIKDKEWQPVIDSIFQKFFDSNIKEAQAFQTI